MAKNLLKILKPELKTFLPGGVCEKYRSMINSFWQPDLRDKSLYVFLELARDLPAIAGVVNGHLREGIAYYLFTSYAADRGADLTKYCISKIIEMKTKGAK